MEMKFNFKRVFLSALCVLMCGMTFAQRIVTGTITDAENKEPLIGASIIAAGTLAGSVTDLDGKFSFQAPADAKQVVISFTGYTTQTLDIPANNQLDIALAPGSVLEAVVVTGYGGTLKQKQVASAISTIRADDFNAGSISDPTQLLQGKVAGLVIAQPGSDPNGTFSVRLRGTSTIAGNTEPLVVVDDVPGVPITSIDPNDIEEITVLKDGSAAALYGARASAGVLIINTKKGTIGKTTVEYNSKVDVSTISNKVSNFSPDEYATTSKALGNKPGDQQTDWFKEITRSAAVSYVQNFGIAGSLGKGSTYRASFTYRNAQGNELNDGYQQTVGRVNLQQYALNDKLKLNLTVNANNRDGQLGLTDAFRYAVTYNPTVAVLGGTAAADNGGYTQIGGFDNFNPVAIVKQSIDNQTINYLQTALGAQLEIYDGLKLKGLYSIQKQTSFEGQYYAKQGLFRGSATDGRGIRFNSEGQNRYFQTYLDYNKTFDKLGVNLTAGYDINDNFYTGNGISAGHIASDALTYNALDQSSDFKKGLGQVNTFAGGSRIAAFFGRVGFSYDDTYNLFATVRREGSSVFSEGNKWGVFPSVSASVDLNKFLQSKDFQQLKLRAGYGITGTLPLRTLLTSTGIAYDGSAFLPVRNPSQNLKWEQKAEFNIGIDFVAMNNRLSGSFDYYTRNITDLLYNFQTIPPGAFEKDGIYANAGSLTSSGFEALLSYDILKSKNQKWHSTLILATNSSTLNSIKTDVLQISPSGRLPLSNVGAPGLNGIPYVLVEPGQPLGQIWTFHYAGPNTAALDVSKDGKNIGAPTVTNRFGKQILLSDAQDSDKYIAGNGLPKLTLGWSNDLKFGRFGITANFNCAFGHSLVNEFRLFYENTGGIANYNVVKTKYYDQRLTVASFNDSYVESASYVRLNYLQLSYDFNLGANTKYVKFLKAFVASNNVATITGYTGVDPEVRFSDKGSVDNAGDNRGNTPDGLVPGIDRRNTYFLARTFTFGVNVGF